MPTPDFVVQLRERVGHLPLWLSGATAVILRERGGRTEVLLVRRADNGAWTPVSGIVDPGEDPHQTVVREAMEEAQVVIEVDRLVWLHVSDLITYDNGDQTRYLDHTFGARWVSGEPSPGDDEATDARFFDVEALPEMAASHRRTVEVVLADEPEVRLG